MMDDRDTTFAPPPQRNRGWVAPLVLVVLAFAGGVALAAYAIHRWSQVAKIVDPAGLVQPAPVVSPPIRVAPVPPPALAASADAVLTERVDRIETQIADIDSRATEASGDADRAEGLLVAFAARRALDRGQPMGFLEPLLRRHFGGTEPQSVATIIATGQRPITLVQLEQRFAEIAPMLAGPAPSEGWWTALRREAGTLFVIRRADEPSAVPTDRVARADRALALGRVDVALDEVARLPGAAKAGDWIAGARRYALARNALDRIETAALLAPDTSVPPPRTFRD